MENLFENDYLQFRIESLFHAILINRKTVLAFANVTGNKTFTSIVNLGKPFIGEN